MEDLCYLNTLPAGLSPTLTTYTSIWQCGVSIVGWWLTAFNSVRPIMS
ncbi:MAG: hypothetical protein II950_06200 [Prevotella sp.]|nr:hypothetical protein [Prevotella sp.]